MPSYRHHELGDLYIQFTIDFPDKLDETAFAQLEAALPKRVSHKFPTDAAHVEDVYSAFLLPLSCVRTFLMDFYLSLTVEEPDRAKQARRDAEDMDMDDEDPRAGGSVNCAQS